MLTSNYKLPVAMMFGVLAISVLSVTSNASAQSMVGSWNMSVKIDQKAMDKAMAEVKNEQQKAIFSQLVPAMKAMKGTLDIAQDGKYTMTVKVSFLGQEQTNKQEGTWKVVKEDGKSIVVETTENGKTKKDTHNITRIDKDNFVEAAPKEMGPLATAMKLQYSRKK
jgi:hypothetical protein